MGASENNPKPPPTESSLKASLTNGHSVQPGTLRLCTDLVLRTYTEAKAVTDAYVISHGLGGYVENVLPKLNLVCLGYIRKAFKQLEIEISNSLSPDPFSGSDKGERIACLPRHERFVNLLHHLLHSHSQSMVSLEGSCIDAQPPVTLFKQLRDEYPAHGHDYDLIELVGGQLADCLAGRAEGVQVIFGSAAGCKIVSAMYGQSPINMVWIQQLRDFLQNFVSRVFPPPPTGETYHGETLKILEVGAGTGGTTAQILPILAQLGVAVQYTVTDISSSLVAAARKRFKEYDWVRYRVLDLEKPVESDLVGSQHIVLATNCVHVTSHVVDAAARLRLLLRPDDGGLLVMLEMTQTLAWIDFFFGLLEGWWQFDDGRTHALQPAPAWKETLCRAGYHHVDWTDGKLPETAVQRLILATASTSGNSRMCDSSGERVVPVLTMSGNETEVDLGECPSLKARGKMIDKYVPYFSAGLFSSQFPPHQCNDRTGTTDDAGSSPSSAVVLLTGATGSLGSHLVQHFAGLAEVSLIVCLNRRCPSMEAAPRQMHAFTTRGIRDFDGPRGSSKLHVFETDTSRPLLGLSRSDYEYIASRITHVVHNAWPMSVTRPLQGYEAQFHTM